MTTQTEALKMALEALNTNRVMAKDSEGNYTREITPKLIVEAITAIKEALAQPEQDKERCVGCEACIDTACGRDECPNGWPKAPQRTWVGLMRGVRVEGDTVVISVKGGNDAARELCGHLIDEMN